MATYQILKRNAVFKGAPGDLIEAGPGDLINAHVRAGLLTRIDLEETTESEEIPAEGEGEKPTKPDKKKTPKNG